jgi:4-aminobutyrate aminotransferase / (S)-3-amino-2-methylpropionate transaminase / 5-aminovalerate transaminase
MSGFDFNVTPKSVPLVKSKYRSIVTKIPVPESIQYFETLDFYESISMHGQLPVIWDRAEDFQVYDKWGNKWIDFTSTIFVANSGHSNSRIVDSIKKLLSKPLMHTYTYVSEERVEYLKYLIDNTPSYFEKAYLLSAGTEATEAVLKLMRMYGNKNRKRKPGIITFEGNWHGRTLGAQMMSYNPAQKEWVGYHDPNIFHLPFPYPWRKDAVSDPGKYFYDNIEKLINEKNIDIGKDICGFVLETFQGWGAIFYPNEFVKAVYRFAKDHDILIAFDEMQAGFGRTGKLFGYMHYDVEPDLIALGKGASSSLPLSIVLGRKDILDLPEMGSMSSTHSANPMVCAAGKANLEALLEDGLIDNAENLGNIFHKKLDDIKNRYSDYIAYVLGKGLIAGVIFYDKNRNPLSHICDAVAEKAMQKGLLVVHTGRESIKLGPPLCITKDALIEGLNVFEEAIKETIDGL